MKNSGLAIHCHHGELIEYCYDYQGRVDYIKSDKPKHEIPTRLRLFKLLSDEAIADLPEDLIKAYADWKKACADLEKARTVWDKAYADWGKARADWDKADAAWPQESKDAWHKKWCGCKEWNGHELEFTGEGCIK